MLIISQNMGGGGPGNSVAKHERAWRYLEDLDFDVALLQEASVPEWAHRVWPSIIERHKYAKFGERSRRTLWGCAIISRLKLETFEPDERFPWLRHLEGSTAIARVGDDPRWLASVHAHASQLKGEDIERIGADAVPVVTKDGTRWETDVIPHELRQLFGDETFIWGGDLNSAERMDDHSYFHGGNRRLRELWREGGTLDLRHRFYAGEQRTFYRPGDGPTRGNYQLDHVFADARTESRVTDWHVDARTAHGGEAIFDHACVVVELDGPPREHPAAPVLEARKTKPQPKPKLAESATDRANLCRGWNAEQIREAVLAAGPAQQDILATIAANPGISGPELADRLGLNSWQQIGPRLGVWTKNVTKPMGIVDPADGRASWPFEFEPVVIDGAKFSRYVMSPAVCEIVLDALGRS